MLESAAEQRRVLLREDVQSCRPSPKFRHVARPHASKNRLSVLAAVNHLVERELSEAARERLQRSRHAVRSMVALITENLVPERYEASPAEELVLAKDVVNVVERVEERACEESGRSCA